ncbi:hypothetical protein QWZ13_12240 [Reinekea marina]|uniref:hypothetical protein n=1 Tax=Reinekea marina TaxID=1310421 RepID=UPI0025B402BC|nr:hypothetical protein [Reinekea marina]MDN3649684.1 hypothetical protein [Reinekea marina]
MQIRYIAKSCYAFIAQRDLNPVGQTFSLKCISIYISVEVKNTVLKWTNHLKRMKLGLRECLYFRRKVEYLLA